MTAGEPFVSPYLLRPLRSFEEALRDRERLRNPLTISISGSDTALRRGSGASGASVAHEPSGASGGGKTADQPRLGRHTRCT